MIDFHGGGIYDRVWCTRETSLADAPEYAHAECRELEDVSFWFRYRDCTVSLGSVARLVGRAVA